MSLINFPKDTVIELKVEKSINQSVLKILNPFFKIEIFIVSSSYFKGLPQVISNNYFYLQLMILPFGILILDLKHILNFQIKKMNTSMNIFIS